MQSARRGGHLSRRGDQMASGAPKAWDFTGSDERVPERYRHRWDAALSKRVGNLPVTLEVLSTGREPVSVWG